jgi:hypothetical protein
MIWQLSFCTGRRYLHAGSRMLEVTVWRHRQVTIDSRFFSHVVVMQNSVEISCSELEW